MKYLKMRKRILRISIKLLLVAGLLFSVLTAYAANAWKQRRLETAYIANVYQLSKTPCEITEPASALSKLAGNVLF